MKNLLALTLTGLFTQMSWAGCEQIYSEKIKDLTSMMNPARMTIITNLGAEVALVSTLAIAGGAISVGVAGLPAVAVGAGGYLSMLAVQRRTYTKTLFTLKQAEAGQGPVLDQFVHKVLKKNKFADKEMIKMAILRLNAENAFCEENPLNGKIKIAKFGRMKKLVLNEL